MDIPNAFIGAAAQPAIEAVFAALGTSAETWQQLVQWLAEQGVAEQEWSSVSPKYGWSLRLKRKKRTILYMGPCNGCFRVAFVLGAKAVAAAHLAGLPKDVVEALNQAPRYAEGTGLRLMVKGTRDLAAIRKLALVKLAN